MTQKIKSISDPKIRLEILSGDDVQQIHAATLQVIETVGVRFPSAKALEILSAHGAKIDPAKKVARIPAQVIESALAKAPPSYHLAALDPALDLPMDGNHSYLATDGCGVEILDPFSGELRRSTKQDVADIARVADYMEEISFHWVALSAQDCPPESRSLHELEAIWGVSRKHVQTETIVTEPEMEAAIEMAAILAGGRAELRKRPLLSITQCTTSPLGQDGGSLDAGLVAAEAGLPVGFMTMASAASTGPATLAGTLVVGNAEVLAALALMELAYPGCPVYYAAAQTATDLRTGAYTGGGPADFLFGAATNILADFYNIPLSMGAFATGAKEPDWQAAVDNSLSAFMAVSTLSDMLLGAGLLHGSRIFSFEQLLMDCEIWSLLVAMCKGIPVDQDTLALEAISQVGPGGNFLGSRHTLKNMHALWQPTLMDRRPYSAWEAKRDGARQWAAEKARQVLNEYQPEPLEQKLGEELKRIISSLEGKVRD
jgi:trimethylamine---corrinoid protein Co-methyltransferase